MSNTQYRDLLVSIGYSEDEAWNMVTTITKFEEVYHDLLS